MEIRNVTQEDHSPTGKTVQNFGISTPPSISLITDTEEEERIAALVADN